MIDFHSHILPEIDDGSDSPETSIRMLTSYSDRITGVCLTPHFYPSLTNPEDFLEKRKKSWDRLKEAIDKHIKTSSSGIKIPALHLGAEVQYFEGINRCDAMENLIIQGTRLILIEMPFQKWSIRMIENVLYLNQDYGIRPILAHINRYKQDKKLLEYYLSNRGLVQVNCEAFNSLFSSIKTVRMIKNGYAHFLGSDAHNTNTRRPNYDSALDKLLKFGLTDVIERIQENEERYISNADF